VILTYFRSNQALRTSIKNTINGMHIALKEKDSQLETDMDSLHKNEIATAEKLKARISSGNICFILIFVSRFTNFMRAVQLRLSCRSERRRWRREGRVWRDCKWCGHRIRTLLRIQHLTLIHTLQSNVKRFSKRHFHLSYLIVLLLLFTHQLDPPKAVDACGIGCASSAHSAP
jgi:hypothetical protein